MILTRAPLRIGLAGGGTDLEAYYGRHGGFVVSTTINKYFYVFLSPGPPDGVQISSSDYRTFSRRRRGEPPLWDGDLGLVKAVLHEFGIEGGISLFLTSEVPPGTGLGSSSAVAVALIKALAAYQGRTVSRDEVAQLACTIEIQRLGSPIGKQDQYAAAFGGLNGITFSAGGVGVEPLSIEPKVRAQLEDNLLLFFLGSTRSANSILAQQQQSSAADDSETVASLHELKAMAIETARLLAQGRLREFGCLMDASWQQKKRLAKGVSNSRIDELYELARAEGALGGKVTGAGGGGFMLLYCEPADQAHVAEVLERRGLFRLDYRFDGAGAMTLTNTEVRPWPGYIGRTIATAAGVPAY